MTQKLHKNEAGALSKIRFAKLMSCFIDSIRTYHELGAPKLPTPIMSSEDIDFAMSVNHCEVQEAVGQVIDDEVVHVPALVDEVDVIGNVMMRLCYVWLK